jgi:hypothetical protein
VCHIMEWFLVAECVSIATSCACTCEWHCFFRIVSSSHHDKYLVVNQQQ